jgi:hypothetical protein
MVALLRMDFIVLFGPGHGQHLEQGPWHFPAVAMDLLGAT